MAHADGRKHITQREEWNDEAIYGLGGEAHGSLLRHLHRRWFFVGTVPAMTQCPTTSTLPKTAREALEAVLRAGDELISYYESHTDTAGNVTGIDFNMCEIEAVRAYQERIRALAAKLPAEQPSSTYRPSTLAECIYTIRARLSERLSPAESRELLEAVHFICAQDELKDEPEWLRPAEPSAGAESTIREAESKPAEPAAPRVRELYDSMRKTVSASQWQNEYYNSGLWDMMQAVSKLAAAPKGNEEGKP